MGYGVMHLSVYLSLYVTAAYLIFTVKDVSVNPNTDEVADMKYVNEEQLKELLRKADTGEEGSETLTVVQTGCRQLPIYTNGGIMSRTELFMKLQT